MRKEKGKRENRLIDGDRLDILAKELNINLLIGDFRRVGKEGFVGFVCLNIIGFGLLE